MSYFPRDIRAESELGNYLEKYYYSRLSLESYQRIMDKNQQLHGVDSIIKNGNRTLIVDEKGLLSISKPINTFALELSYFKDKSLKQGWLFDQSKKTTHYLFCWVKRDEVELDIFKEENIHYVLAMLVERGALHRYLEKKYGITENVAQNEAQNIIKQNKGGRLKNLKFDSFSRYHYSIKLPEQPVNIVMDRRDFWESQSIESFHLVKRSEIKDISLK